MKHHTLGDLTPPQTTQRPDRPAVPPQPTSVEEARQELDRAHAHFTAACEYSSRNRGQESPLGYWYEAKCRATDDLIAAVRVEERAKVRAMVKKLGAIKEEPEQNGYDSAIREVLAGLAKMEQPNE